MFLFDLSPLLSIPFTCPSFLFVLFFFFSFFFSPEWELKYIIYIHFTGKELDNSPIPMKPALARGTASGRSGSSSSNSSRSETLYIAPSESIDSSSYTPFGNYSDEVSSFYIYIYSILYIYIFYTSELKKIYYIK